MAGLDPRLDVVPIGTMLPLHRDKEIPDGWQQFKGQTLSANRYPEFVRVIYANWQKNDAVAQLVKEFWNRWGGKVAHDGEYIVLPTIPIERVPEIVWGTSSKNFPPLVLIIKVNKVTETL